MLLTPGGSLVCVIYRQDRGDGGTAQADQHHPVRIQITTSGILRITR